MSNSQVSSGPTRQPVRADRPRRPGAGTVHDAGMATERTGITRTAAIAAAVVAALSVVYAVFYLIVAPAAQRGSDPDAMFRSYLAAPTGMRVASLCLFISGVLTTLVYAGLHGLAGRLSDSVRTWALALGVVSGVATTAHGLTNLINMNTLAHAYARGDAVTRAAVVVTHSAALTVDPRGLATFGLVGAVVFAFSWHLRDDSPKLSILGQVLGVDMALLFVASATSSAVPILITGGLASLILGPAWWLGVARRLGRVEAPAAVMAQPAVAG
jgi:hypothetical protein